MSTKSVNNSGPLGPLVAPKAQDAQKTDDASGVAGALKTAVAGAGAKAAQRGAANYDVKLSTGGRERAEAQAKALDIARNTPDIREDRVAELKKRVQEGTYEVDSGKIADGMLKEAIMDRLAESDDA